MTIATTLPTSVLMLAGFEQRSREAGGRARSHGHQRAEHQRAGELETRARSERRETLRRRGHAIAGRVRQPLTASTGSIAGIESSRSRHMPFEVGERSARAATSRRRQLLASGKLAIIAMRDRADDEVVSAPSRLGTSSRPCSRSISSGDASGSATSTSCPSHCSRDQVERCGCCEGRAHSP